MKVLTKIMGLNPPPLGGLFLWYPTARANRCQLSTVNCLTTKIVASSDENPHIGIAIIRKRSIES